MPKVFSLPIFTKEFRRSVPSVILWFLISGGLLVLALYSFSAAAQTDFSDRLQETLSAFPEELLAEFQLDNLPELSEFLTYFALTSHCVFAVGCLFACYRGCRSMVKLESHQSIVLIYAQPISRGSILISSFVSQALALLIYNLGLWGVSYGMAALQPDFDAASFALACLSLYFSYFMVEVMYLAIGYLLSVFLSHSSQASAAALRFCWPLCCLESSAARFPPWAGCCFSLLTITSTPAWFWNPLCWALLPEFFLMRSSA